MCTSTPSSVNFPNRGRLLSNQNSGCITVKRIDMIIMGTESNAMKMPSLDDKGPLKPPLSSATRQQERIKRQTAATAAPEVEKEDTSDHDITVGESCRLPIMYPSFSSSASCLCILRHTMARRRQNIAVNKTCVARPAIIRSTPMGSVSNIAAREPPHPMKQRHIKSPRMNREAKSRGLKFARRADV